jgi:hypothetical protein
MARTHRCRAFAIAIGLCLAGSAAQALSISGIAIAAPAGNTANSIGTTGSNRFQIASATSLGPLPGPVADVAGASLSFDTRYAALVASDREAGGGTTATNATASYTITFTVNNPTGGTYRIDLGSSRIGALTLVNDGGGNATATLGAVTGLLNGVANPSLALAAVGPLSGAAGGNQAFSQATPTLSIVDSALTKTFTLAFSWTASTSSSRDEAAVRLGISGGLGTTTADDYPGVGGRSAAGDGHLVHVALTLLTVPEPSPALLVAAGLLALARRRRA